MVLFNLVPRNKYHKNGTQWIGKILARLIKEKNYEFVRLEKRVLYAKYWYAKQTILFRFQTQFPNIAFYFSLLNKQDTSVGFPAKRNYERFQDFAVFNIIMKDGFNFISLHLQFWFWFGIGGCWVFTTRLEGNLFKILLRLIKLIG